MFNAFFLSIAIWKAKTPHILIHKIDRIQCFNRRALFYLTFVQIVIKFVCSRMMPRVRVSFHFSPSRVCLCVCVFEFRNVHSPYAMSFCLWFLSIFLLFSVGIRDNEKNVIQAQTQSTHSFIQVVVRCVGTDFECENKSTTNSATAYIIWRWQKKDGACEHLCIAPPSPPIVLMYMKHIPHCFSHKIHTQFKRPKLFLNCK